MSTTYPPTASDNFIGQAATSNDTYVFPVYQSNPENPSLPLPFDMSQWQPATNIVVQNPDGSTFSIPSTELIITQVALQNTVAGGTILVWQIAFETTVTTFPVSGTYVLQGVIYLPGTPPGIKRTRKVVISIERQLEVANSGD